MNRPEILERLSVHQLGNKSQGDPLHLAPQPVLVEQPHLHELLLSYFLDHFKGVEFFHLNHSPEAPNEIYLAASKIFDDPENLHFQSTVLARKLFDLGTHPNIKSGDFYVALIRNVLLEDELIDGLGIFKAETKDHFLKVNRQLDGRMEILSSQGTYTGRLDKGCIIYNIDPKEGFRVEMIDKTNRSEAQYWKDDFLNLSPCQNDYFHTQQVMGLTKSFLDQLPLDFDVDRPDQIDMMNKSLDYFKSHAHFDENEFADEVFQDLDVASAFGEFSSNYRNTLPSTSDFELDERAVKNQARHFKSILKLDRNFHIYIHGDRSLIQKGVDGEGRKYYKIYYSVES